MNQAMRSRGPRIVVTCVILLALSVLFGAMGMQVWSAVGSDSDTLEAERRGIAYLRPMNRLVVELARAQTAAVQGSDVDTDAVEAAVVAVADADRRHGAALDVTFRWQELRAQLEELLQEEPTGAAAYREYTDAVTLATTLVGQVGDSASLTTDQEPGVDHLSSVVTTHLPEAVTTAGRAADQARLGDPDAPDTVVSVALERRQVALAVWGMTDDLARAGSGPAPVGSSLTEPLDVFRVAADGVAAPEALQPRYGEVDPGALAEASGRVADSAIPLAAALFAELEDLLAEREAELDTQRIRVLVTTVVGVLLGVAMLWWAVPPPAETTDDRAAPTADVAAVEVQMPVVDAHDLLAQELVHVGRGVRVQPKEQPDDAQ